MNNNENDKIRIPNETFCPNKKIQFSNILNNNPTNITLPDTRNINNELSIAKDKKSNIDNNLNDNNKIFSQQNIAITNSNTNQKTKININFFSAQDNSSEEGVTISPIKSIITSASSKPQTIIEPQCKLQKFLPPKTSKFHKTLVLDLDETLIHSYFDCPSPRPPDLTYEILIEKKKIRVNSMIRPGAREFLEYVSSIFEVVIFTASLSEYANPLLDFVDQNKKCNFRLYREHCCTFSNGFTNSFTKDLKKLDRDMKNLLIVDNNPKSYMLNKDNGIPIKTWVEDINDKELYRLIPYLIFLSSEKIKDVRPFLKQVNSGNILNYDKFDKIIKDFNLDYERNKKEENKSNNNLINNNTNNNININKENKNLNNNINENINNKINDNISKENKKTVEETNKNIESKNKKDMSNNNMNIIPINNIKDNNKKINKSPNKVNNNNIIKENNKTVNKSPNKINNNMKENIKISKNINKVNNSINENNTKINNNLNKNNNDTNDNNKINNYLNKVNNNVNNKPNNNTQKNNPIINEVIPKKKCDQINNERSNINKEPNKNKSSNNISHIININNKKNSPKRENIKLNKSNEKKNTINEKSNNRNSNTYNTNNNININRLNQNINNSFNRNNNNSSRKKKVNKKTNEKFQKRNEGFNKELQNESKRNNSVRNKNYCVNKLNENSINKNIIPKNEKCNNKENNNNNIISEDHHINNRYEIFFKEEDNLQIDEHPFNENKNISNIIKIQREVKKNNFRNYIFINNCTQEIPNSNLINNENKSLNLNIHPAKSSSNINEYKNNNENLNTPNNKMINNKLVNKTSDTDLSEKVKKDVILNINSYSPPSPNDLLNEYIINLNNTNSLKNSTTSINKNIQFSEELQEKTIINDDIDEDEKNEYKEKKIYEELFDDIDTERDDFNDSNLFINNKKNEEGNDKKMQNFKEAKENLINENKKKCFEVDDALNYYKNIEKEKINEENLDNENIEKNIINNKSSINKNKRKINKNIFNKSRPYPNNTKDLYSSTKLNINSLFVNQCQSCLKNSLNDNNFLQPSKKILPNELFNYSNKKKIENKQNNMTSSTYKIIKEKSKSNLYLKNNANSNNENIDLLMKKFQPISKQNSKLLNIQNNQIFPKTNRNKNSYYENQKISLFKNNDFLNNIKNINEIKPNSNIFYLLKTGDLNGIEKNTNNFILKDSINKIKRPTSCVNKKSEKIFYNQKNEKINKIIKYANQGKKIFLKTNNKSSKASINIENINNAKINTNDNISNNSKLTEDDKSYNNGNKTNKNNKAIFPQETISSSENIVTDVFFMKNMGKQTLKTNKNKTNKYRNFYEDKEDNQKRFPSAMNNKIIKADNKNKLL